MNTTKRALAVLLLTAAALGLSGTPNATASNILCGIGLAGNGNCNDDTSINNSIIAGGSQQNVGQAVNNAQSQVNGNVINDFSATG
ncbi:hypothetical protein [Yinghuangia seranimata]|uniref:hypothetical protein n=1 Tax=Yinghuangia seranimata TaxID=408067 RepID=UPI00248BE4F6|nr:hypothetical protein [Yinghuangia seranimata]MDI2127713.1 hypothetical protein [Yinghuangia seranimata]